MSSVAVEVEIGTANNEPIGTPNVEENGRRDCTVRRTLYALYACVVCRSGDRGDHDNNAKDEDAHGKRNGKERSQPVEGSRPPASPLGTHHVSDIEFGRLFGSACHIRRLHFPRAATGRRSRRVFSLRRTFPMVLRCHENCNQRHRVSTRIILYPTATRKSMFFNFDSS